MGGCHRAASVGSVGSIGAVISHLEDPLRVLPLPSLGARVEQKVVRPGRVPGALLEHLLQHRTSLTEKKKKGKKKKLKQENTQTKKNEKKNIFFSSVYDTYTSMIHMNIYIQRPHFNALYILLLLLSLSLSG